MSLASSASSASPTYLSTVLLALAQSLRHQADCQQQATTAQALAADRAVVAEILAASESLPLSPDEQRHLAQLAEDAAQGDLARHSSLLSGWRDGRSGYYNHLEEVLLLSPSYLARQERETQERRESQEALLAYLAQHPEAAVWSGISDYYAGTLSADGASLATAVRCRAAGLSPSEVALLEARAAQTVAARAAAQAAAAASRQEEEEALERDYAALLRALHPDLQEAAGEIDHACLRREIALRVAGRLDRLPQRDTCGERRCRVSVAAYRALQALRERLLEGSRALASEAGLDPASVRLEVDRYEWRYEEGRGEEGRKGWTCDLTLVIGLVPIPLREVVLDLRS